jgi:hypothetical protein
MPEFETFKKRMVPLKKAPYVTIQKRGTMSFNAAAHAALGNPEAVELLYDVKQQIMGVRAVDPAVEHAYPLRSPSKKDQSFILSGTAFTKYYEIDTTVSTRYPATMEDGILCIDLKQEGTVVTSNRRGTGKKASADTPAGGETENVRELRSAQ